MTRIMFIDPITRIEGHLALRAEVDENTGKVKEAWTVAAMFRGFEVFLRGRAPPDAIHITSRICGVCGSSHANASKIANDMALGAVPEPLGVLLRNMAEGMTDHTYDHPLILNMLGGPDYSEVIVSRLTPSIWDEAAKTKAEFSDIHGFSTIADIMRGLNPLQGDIYVKTIKYQRIAREAGVLIYGRHSHPSTLIPGGISTDLTNAQYLLIEYAYRLAKLTAWAKYLVAIWNDLANFFNENGYLEQGKTYESPILLSAGLFDDPELYSIMGEDYVEIYRNIDKAFEARTIKPGLIINGELVTTKYTEINRSIIEFVESGFYDDWVEKNIETFTETDPLGEKLAWGYGDLYKWHPWNKITLPKPQAIDWASKYTWSTEPRIIWKDGKILPFEVGPIARLWITSLQKSEFGQGNGTLRVTLPRSVVDDLPPGTHEELEFEWKIPKIKASTTIERVRARAFNIALDIYSMWYSLLSALEEIKSGRLKTSRPWKKPTFSLGAGLTEAPRGTVRHWMVVKNYKIANYQIHAPTTNNASPINRKCKGYNERYCRGPFEVSILNSRITEEVPPEEWKGLDFVRAIRSFDPCLACAVHIQVSNRVIKRILVPI